LLPRGDRAVVLRETVGLVGLGEMGLPMAVTVLRGGAAVVAFDVDDGRRAAAAAAGVRVAASCAEVAEAGTVIVMVRTLPQVEEVVLGASGLLAGARPSAAVVLVMSTIDPRAMERLAAGAAERGATVIDAPVSGGVKG